MLKKAYFHLLSVRLILKTDPASFISVSFLFWTLFICPDFLLYFVSGR